MRAIASKNVETAVAFQEAIFRDDYETCGLLLGDGFTSIDRPRGRVMRTAREHQQGLEHDQAWSHRRLELEHAMETTDGAVVLQLSERATHVGTWYGVDATGKEVSVSPSASSTALTPRGASPSSTSTRMNSRLLSSWA